MMKLPKIKLENVVDAVSLLVVYWFLLTIFKPAWILSDTYTTGGDMGSHMYAAEYMRDYLLPNLKLTGWSMAWYGGFPIFEYYFPLPFAAIGLLSWLIPFNLAFKIITASGVFMLPVCTYLSMRLMGFRYPTPAISSVLSLVMLFNEEYNMWGGNIKSTLAGQFTFTIGVALAVLFMGLAYAFVESKKHFLKASICLAAVPMCHIYTMLWAVASAAALAIGDTKEKMIHNINRLSAVYLCGFLLSAFWTLKMLTKFGWSTAFGAWRSQDIWEIIPFILAPYYVLAAAAILLFILRPRRNLGYLIFQAVNPILFYAVIHVSGEEHLLDVRFMPFAYMGILMMSAYTLGSLIEKVKGKWMATLIIILLTLLWVNNNREVAPTSKALMDFDMSALNRTISNIAQFKYVGDVPGWVKWNYEGYEAKTTWGGLKEFFDYLNTLPEGRVVHEFSSAHGSFGTPRTLELIPFFTTHPVLEGLNIESAASSTFHFYMQSEYSPTPTCPISYMRCTTFNLPAAMKHFRYFAPKYLVATSDKLKDEIIQVGGFTHLKSLPNDLDVYLIDDAAPIVEVPEYEPVIVETNDWRATSMSWWKNLDAVDVPLVLLKKASDEDKMAFNGVFDEKNGFENVPRKLTGRECVVDYVIGNEWVDVNTTCPGIPHLVKVTYNPGWAVDGADKVYLASPAFMIIVPEGNHFRLYYADTLAEKIANLLTVACIVVIIISTRKVYGRAPKWFVDALSSFQTNALERECIIFSKISRLRRHWKKAAVLVLALAVVYQINAVIGSSNQECAIVCRNQGYDNGASKFPYIISGADHYDMGYYHQGENREHKLECTAACDNSRGEFVYVNFGHVKFTMKSEPGLKHTLTLRVDDSYWCRTTNITVNGHYIDTLTSGTDLVGWVNRQYTIPAEYIKDKETTIELSHDTEGCLGFDVSDAWLKPVKCSCS